MTKNKTALITGSSRGIGEAAARLLASSGYQVILTGRDAVKLKETAQQIGALDYFVADLTSQSENLFDEIIKKHGTVDILVNNAGEYIWSPVENTTSDDIERILKLNVEAPYRLIQKAIPAMKQNKWGRIINIGSISGAVGEANASLYSMTKSALAGLTKSLALELAQDGITVNTINPGWVDTDLAKVACENSDFCEEENIEMIPQRRFIHPDEVANLIKYLISDETKGLTGQCINLCAGLSIG